MSFCGHSYFVFHTSYLFKMIVMEAIKTRKVLESDWQDPVADKPTRYPAFTFRMVRFSFGTLGRIFPKSAAKVAYKIFSTPRTRAKHRISDEILESARIFEVLYGKQMLKGYEWGKGEKTILLVHGWESRGTAMRSFVRSLTAAGFRVVAMDGPAHGNSDGKSTDLSHFGGAVRAFINQIGDVHGIITHSFGGASTMYALGTIDTSISIKKLVLTGVPNSMELLWEHTVKTLNLPDKAAKNFKKLLEGKVNTSMKKIDSAEMKNRMNVDDILIVHDMEDIIVPFSEAEKNYQDINNSSLLEVNNYGHFRMLKNPDLVTAITDFISEE